MAVKTCKKDCSPENKDKFLSEAGTPGGGGALIFGVPLQQPVPRGARGAARGVAALLGCESGLSPPCLGTHCHLNAEQSSWRRGSCALPPCRGCCPKYPFCGRGEEKLLKAC